MRDSSLISGVFLFALIMLDVRFIIVAAFRYRSFLHFFEQKLF